MRRFQFTILSLFLFAGFLAKATELKFSEPSYAGNSLTFYTIPNFLTEKKVILGDATVGADGSFNLTFELAATSTIFCEFDVYQGWMIADPKGNYEMAMPPKQENTSTNPYFKPRLIHFGIKNSDVNEINRLIEGFLRVYKAELAKNIQEILYRRSVTTAETMVAQLQEQFHKTDNEYFENYKMMQYANVIYSASIRDPKLVIDRYLNGKPILYSNADYAELFDKIFTKYLQYACQDVNGQKIMIMLNSGAYEQLINWLVLDVGYDTELAEAIILKGMKLLFYSKKFNTMGLFNILMEIKENSTIAIHQDSADKIHKELAQTMYGAIAPELSLLDDYGGEVDWEYLKGKYVYLCFTRSDNETFIAHKKLMAGFYEKFSDDLELVIVLENDFKESEADLINPEGFDWTILRGSTRREVYEDFNVRRMPAYFLIDPQGRMSGASAPWPDENFEIQFSAILRSSEN